MSPKNCSLAYDRIQELEIIHEERFEPNLTLLIPVSCEKTATVAEAKNAIRIRGTVTVSF